MIYDYAPTYYYAKERKSKTRTYLRIFFLFLIIATTYISLFIIPKNKPRDEAVAGTTTLAAIPAQTREEQKKNILGSVVENALQGAKANYGIVILNLKTNEYYLRNERLSFTAASLYKLWVMGEALEQIRSGTLDEKDKLSADIDALYEKFNLASPSANTNITTTVNDALEKMITVSDNTTALLLAEKLKVTNIKTFLEENSFTGSKIGTSAKEPITTPYDIAIFLKKAYSGELVDQNTSAKMLEILKRQRLNAKLPKYLPGGTIIAHKTGELDEYTHDAGIVYTDKGDYIIVVMSESDPTSRLQADERIATISREVYKYFTTKN